MPDCVQCETETESGAKVTVEPFGDTSERLDKYTEWLCPPCLRMFQQIAEYEDTLPQESVEESFAEPSSVSSD